METEANAECAGGAQRACSRPSPDPLSKKALVIGVLFLGELYGTRSGLHAQALRLDPIATATAEQLDGIRSVAGVVTDPHARLFLLDSIGRRVIVTDASLRFLSSFGRGGVAPGEFREPVSIARLGHGRVAVLDKALRRVTLLTVRDTGAPLALYRTVPIPTAAEAMCAAGDGVLLIYGLSAGKRLHLVTLEGRLLRSFAPVDPRLSPMAQDLVTKGRVGCDSVSNEVLVSSDFLPLVEAFRISTGERIWSDSLKPFRAVALRDQGRSVSISSGRAGFSLISSLFTRGEHRVFQTRFESRRDNASVDTVVTYVYSKAARGWRPLSFEIPLLFRLPGGEVLSVELHARPAMIRLNRVTIQ